MHEQSCTHMVTKKTCWNISEHILHVPSVHVLTDRKKYIRLDLNENPSLLGRDFMAKLKKLDAFTVGAYPEYNELQRRLSSYTGIDVANIALFDGSDHAIELLISLLFKKGDMVVLPEPTFFIYRHKLTLAQVSIHQTLYSVNETNEIVFPFAETLAALNKNTKGLLLCNPNNPTGTLIPQDQLQQLIQKAYKLHIPVIIDEAYFEFYGTSAIPLITQYNNVIVIRTFSKGFGLAGLRIGYVAADTALIAELTKLQLPWSVNHFAVSAAILALKEKRSFAKKRQELLKRKKKFESFLQKQKIHFYRSSGNFLLLQVSNDNDFFDKMKRNGILVGKPYSIKPSFEILKNTIRMSIPSDSEFTKVCTVIKKSIT